jgi:GNAT superfamily N-acetyltransferase
MNTKFRLIDEEEAFDLDADPYELASRVQIRPARTSEFRVGHFDDGTDTLASALFVSTDGGVFSFDIVVDPDYRKSGLAYELIKYARDEFRELKEMGAVDRIELDVVNPIMRSALEKQGFRVKSERPGHTVMENKIRKIVRRILKEEIGRNYHTVDPTPNTWDTFEDFEIEYYPQDTGEYLVDISFKGKKLIPTTRFGSHADAEHYARMVVDKYRVEWMNRAEKEIT